MNGGGKEQRGALETAGAIVGLLAGVVALVYVLGGLVLALRLMFDHFSFASVVTIIGQLPRELVVTTAMLDVLLPAFTFGLMVALGAALLGVVRGFPRRVSRRSRLVELSRLSRLEGVVLVLVAGILVSLPVGRVVATQGWTPALLSSLIGLVVTAIFALVAWSVSKVVAEGRWQFGPKLLAIGGLASAVALTPAVMYAAALDFEDARVCVSESQLPETGQLIGEGGGRVLLENQFGKEASVVSLHSDRVTKTEFGDLSSTFSCPAPPGSEVAGAEAPKLGGHGSEEELRLAMALRPRLRFDSRERWRPIAVDSFLRERFEEGSGHGACASGADPPCLVARGVGQLTRRKDAPAYIDIHGAGRDLTRFASPDAGCLRSPPALDCNSGPAAAIYYRRTTREGRWYWDYWWFFRYSDYTGRVNRCAVICGDHEGDWEGITVITTASGEPEVLGAIFAAHRDRALVDGAMLPTANGHPLVWIATGTHASYPFDCDGDCKQYNGLPEDPHDGAVPWGGNRDSECAASECVRPLPEVGKPSEAALPIAGGWAGWPGKWGETCHDGCPGLRHRESSPSSPGLQTRFQCPWVATRRAKPSPDGSGLSDSDPVGDTERLLALCQAQRGGR
jgi:hypothetical protein